MKEHILDEIRRLASENDGKAPSIRKFRAETEISDEVWYGTYWARWRDAVLEAGLTPNEMQREKLSDEALLNSYAEACRHFGKPPSNAELNLFAKAKDGSFPGVKTLSRRFGGKEKLNDALRLYASQTEDADLMAILPEKNSIHQLEDSETNTLRDGSVYLLKSGDHYKIGRSDEVEKRVKQISISLPEKLELVHAIKTDDASGIEAYWHRRFSDRRANGEWFRLSRSDVTAFKRRKFQ